MNGEGGGVDVMVGIGTGISVGAGVGVAGAEQDASKMASRPRPEKKRGILSKGKVETIGKLSHGFSQQRIQIGIFVFEHLFGDRG